MLIRRESIMQPLAKIEKGWLPKQFPFEKRIRKEKNKPDDRQSHFGFVLFCCVSYYLFLFSASWVSCKNLIDRIVYNFGRITLEGRVCKFSIVAASGNESKFN